MTVAYTLPDGTEFVSTQEEHPLVVTRESAGIVPCDDWTGPIHECAVNEDVVRAMAKEGGARLAVTFTHEGETSKDAETGEETKGDDVISTVPIELASLVLGSTRVAERVYDVDDASGGTPFPTAFAGYRRVVIGVRLVNAPAEDAGEEDADVDANGNAAASASPPPFLPEGLARDLRPFAVTLHVASDLPDAPASSADVDARCEPISAHLAWRRPKTETSLWPKNEDAAGDDTTDTHSRVVSWRTASSTTPWRTVTPLESFSAAFRTRDARFDEARVFIAKDLPIHLHDACAAAPLTLRLHDRTVSEVPEQFPGLDKLEGAEGGADPGADTTGEGGTVKTDAEGFPLVDVYAKAIFDLRRCCERPWTQTKFTLEANLEPASALPCGAGALLDWTSRPGRYVEAHSTMTMTFETCLPLTDPREPPTKKNEDETAEETAEVPADPGAEEGAEEPTPVPPIDPRPFARCVFAMHYSNVSLFREILKAVRTRNAKTLSIDGTPAHVLFELAHAKFDGSQIADPAFEVLTGFHVIDGVTRLILVEGTVGDVMDPIFEIAAREASNPAARVLFNRRLGYDARAYGDLGGDIWPVKLADTVPALASSPAVLAGDGVRAAVRDCLLVLNQLLDGQVGPRWMRDVESSRLFPGVSSLILLDKRFGSELTVTDLTGEAPRPRGTHRHTRTDADEALESYVQKAAAKKQVSVDVLRRDVVVTNKEGEGDPLSPGTARGKARRRVHPPLDMTTPLDGSYLTDLANRRRVRIRRDLTADYLAMTATLQQSLGNEKRRAWQEWNVRRITVDQEAEIKAKEAETAAIESERAEAERVLEAKGRKGKPLHASPFKWPVAPTYAGDHKHPKHPGDMRVAELKVPWDAPTIDFDVTMHCPDKWKVPSPTRTRNGPSFDKIPAPPDRLFETDPAFFNSVHLYGKDLIKEKKDAVIAERATWRAKCVVDNPGTMEYPTGVKGMNVTLPRKDYAEIPVVDRYKSILHDPPVKLGIAGKRVKGAEHPAPVSMYLREDPEVTNPHSKLNLLSLREIDTTRFTAGDFKRHNLVRTGDLHTGTLDLVGAEDDGGNKVARYRRDRSLRRE